MIHDDAEFQAAQTRFLELQATLLKARQEMSPEEYPAAATIARIPAKEILP